MSLSPTKSRIFTVTMAVILSTLGLTRQAAATVVEFQTSLGNFSVNLFDDTTPTTVANFLNYVNNGAYTSSIVHRVDQGFVIQGGGFAYSGMLPVSDIAANPAIANEPLLSNVRGTIAMAKLGGDADSATNQWFFNLSDNSANLDSQNSGFTVFGVVLDNGMDVVDAIADTAVFNFGSPLNLLPLRNYSATDFSSGVDPTEDNFVLITAVVLTDSTVSTGTDLLPPDNITIEVPPPPPALGGGGGVLGLLGLIALLGVTLGRRRWQELIGRV